ncbi:MAG: sigma 54-interacting transcriptional regulator [bacterium]
MSDEHTEVFAASMRPASLHPIAASVMAELGIDLTSLPLRTPLDIEVFSFDMVVTLGGFDPNNRLNLPGMPPQFQWKQAIAEPVPDGMSTEDAFRQTRDDLKRRIAELFSSETLQGLSVARRNLELVLDNLAYGVLAHTVNRRIFHFNQAAERITGFHRDDVIGRDCHKVFRPKRFCGGDCSFCDTRVSPEDLNKRKTVPVDFTTTAGDRRVLEMTISPLADVGGANVGAVVSFTDATELESLRRRVKHHYTCGELRAKDPAMLALFDQIRELGPTNLPVLIEGASGTGKELVAKAIHAESPRADQPFVAINCGALPEGILESELFGHVRGSFTGAVRDQRGRFELAHRGTLLLDEIGDLPQAMQVKLLRVLQEHQFERLGGEKPITVDVRIISATNQNLNRLMEQNRFRRDLYYRLCVAPIRMPALRDRRLDIPVLVDHFLEQVSTETGRPLITVSNEALDLLTTYAWPGNVRELRNIIEYSYIKCRSGSLEPQHLPKEVVSFNRAPRGQRGPRLKLNTDQVVNALKESKGDKAKAARLLGVGRSTLYRFIRRTAE